ncbi:transposase [Roseospira visakhapatnamensis]|uniref:Mutator family transposase n=1 Tax=Roseospira visakhapatnamensis TaxID=390880 RepID=A0A7W6RI29_9PROT|nr:transposase [Roseospira visakhapatnamensis]MBB4268288.1 transposase-like protein [Roseospira visakhapatnamensis]
MQDTQGKVIAALMEQLIQTGPEGMAEAFTALFNLAMRMERDQHLGAGRYERSNARQGYANGYKPKKVDTPAGTVTVAVPKSRGCDEPFFPRSLERGRRSSRAIMLAIAEMYVQGVSTRDAAKVMKEFGLESLSSTQVSRAAALLDDELEAWRTRRLDPVTYLILDARYEKVRDGGIVRDAAILSAIVRIASARSQST